MTGKPGRNSMIYGGAIGLLGASLYFVATQLWDQQSFDRDPKRAEDWAEKNRNHLEASAARATEIRLLVKPCYDSSADLRELAKSGQIIVSELAEQSASTSSICQQQLSAMSAAQMELGERQLSALRECETSVELEAQLAEEFERIAAQAEDIGGQDEEDRVLALGARANSQLSKCDSLLSDLEASTQFLNLLERQ